MTRRWMLRRAGFVPCCIMLLSCRTAATPAPAAELSESRANAASIEVPWTAGKIPYVIDGTLTADSLAIMRVMRRWEDGTPVRFVPRTDADVHYVDIVPGDCTTYDRDNVTIVSADTACVGHELGHAIGLRHEHQRPDRDRYVTIRTPWWWLWGRSQYDVIPMQLCRPYDLSSIMHYHIDYIVPKAGLEITRRDNEPSALDLLSVRQLYGAAPCQPQSPGE